MRVSRNEQTTDRQEDHLRQAGCEKIFKDVISEACKTRPGLDEALNYCRPGDTESGLGIGSTRAITQALN